MFFVIRPMPMPLPPQAKAILEAPIIAAPDDCGLSVRKAGVGIGGPTGIPGRERRPGGDVRLAAPVRMGGCTIDVMAMPPSSIQRLP